MLPINDKNIPYFEYMEYKSLYEEKRQIELIIAHLEEKY